MFREKSREVLLVFQTGQKKELQMKKEWFFDRYCGHLIVALLENGELTEFAAESEKRGDLVGNIYKGTVVNVLPGMQAAFVSCGLERNCYLSTEETFTDYSKYDGTPVRPTSLKLKEGDEVIVQVTKPPRGNKGAKVTTKLSFVGKRLIYLPTTEFFGISRKITHEETRAVLLDTVQKMSKDPGEGFIVRTQALYASKKALEKESAYLKKLYCETIEKAAKKGTGTLLYRDSDLPFRVVRDSIGDDVASITVGDRALYDRLTYFAKMSGDVSPRKISYAGGDRAMFRRFGIDKLMYDAIRPNIIVPGGGYIVVQQTEAMTVVDVNTGSFIGDVSLEETAFSVNLLAAREIARQVRLRNVGGLVVVDFIDMEDPEHRRAVTDELTKALQRDKAKCKVLPMSEFCLTEFTRKRIGSEVPAYFFKPCTHCHSRGFIQADVFVVSRLRADIKDAFADGYKAVVVELNERLMLKILREGWLRDEANGEWKEKRVYMIPHKTFEDDEFTVRGDNSGVLTLPDKAQILY